MGGSSSSSSTQKSTEFNNLGTSRGGLAGNINLEGGSSIDTGEIAIQQTDQGAIKQAGALGDAAFDTVDKLNEDNTDLAKSVVATQGETAQQGLDLAGAISDEAFDATEQSVQEVKGAMDRSLAFAEQATRSENNKLAENLTKYGVVGLLGLSAVMLLATRGG